MEHFKIFFTYIFISNILLSRFLGLCPFFGISKNLSSAIGMGIAVTFVLTVSSFFCSLLYYYLLLPFHIGFLKLLIFIFIIASLVQILEVLLNKFTPYFYHLFGIYLPLITTNCAILGVILWNIDKDQLGLLQSTISGLSAGLGFLLVTILLSGIQNRIALEKVPPALQGKPIAFISAGLMAIGFYSFDHNLLVHLGF